MFYKTYIYIFYFFFIFLGAAHRNCNLQYRINPEKIQVPVFLHNLKSYDSHLILMAAKPCHGEISIVPQNMEKYISFKIGDITFKDSLAFMPKSLSSLVNNLRKEQLVYTRRYLENSVIEEEFVDMNDALSVTASDNEFIDDTILDEHYDAPESLTDELLDLAPNVSTKQLTIDDDDGNGTTRWKRNCYTRTILSSDSENEEDMDFDDDYLQVLIFTL